MSDFELSPRWINPTTLILGIGGLITTSILAIFVLPKLYALYLDVPNDPVILQILIPVSVVIVTIWVVFIFAIIYTLGKKIEVNGKLVYFKKKSMLGFGKWMIDNVIDFSKVAQIKDRSKTGFISTGQYIVTYVIYWVIFEMKDGTKQELLLNGWDISSLKNLFYYLRGRFPEIKFDNAILKDTPEKLSGIDELLKQSPVTPAKQSSS